MEDEGVHSSDQESDRLTCVHCAYKTLQVSRYHREFEDARTGPWKLQESRLSGPAKINLGMLRIGGGFD